MFKKNHTVFLIELVKERQRKEMPLTLKNQFSWHLSRNTNKIAESAGNRDTVVDFFTKIKQNSFRFQSEGNKNKISTYVTTGDKRDTT